MEDGAWQLQVDPLTERELDVLRLVAAGASDREIAEALFLSPNTVKWHNRQIYSKLGVGSRTQAVAVASQEGLLAKGSIPLESATLKRKNNLPAQINSFVGREKEMDEIRELLKSYRLLTLCGPAGVGKTRLATQLGLELVKGEEFEDGVFLVDLASISEPARVADAIAEALDLKAVAGLPVASILINSLRNKELLLVLDNFEHVIEAAPLVAELLAAGPEMKVIVTSRQPLSLYGEQEYPVSPLKLPDNGKLFSLPAIEECEATSLFLQRARAIKYDFKVSEEELPSVVEICVRLDGLPLAIELAAVQVRLFRPQALLSQLESRFTVLKHGPLDFPERHQTLGAAIDWSYELLDETEKALFARLSVFQGGCTIEAVERICCNDMAIDVLDGLMSLTAKNLLQQVEDPDGGPRFKMLETINEYARKRLEDWGDLEEICWRHLKYFTTLAEQADLFTRGGRRQLFWLSRLEAEHKNLRAAYRWSRKNGESELTLSLVGSLGYFWWRQGHFAEGEDWVRQALEMEEGSLPETRARVLFTAGIVFFYLNQAVESKRELRKALAIFRELGMQREIAWTLSHLSIVSPENDLEYEEAAECCEESLELHRATGDKAGIVHTLNTKGELARFQGDFPKAKQAYKEAREVAIELEDGLMESILLVNLGFIALNENDPVEAEVLFQQSLELLLEVGHTVYIADKLMVLSSAAAARGQLERAARLSGAAEALYEKQGHIPQAGDLSAVEHFEISMREELGTETFESARAEGRRMRFDQAVAYALGESVFD